MYNLKKIQHIKGLMLVTILFTTISLANAASVDKHYTSRGFFDIHVCNWPNRPLFFMVVFSTNEYSNLKSVDIFDINNTKLTSLDLSKFKVIKRKGKKDKRVFIKQVDIPKNSKDGIYTATANFKKGQSVTASDYVIIKKMRIVTEVIPKTKTELSSSPTELKWKEIDGAKHYKVFIRDMWRDGKVIFKSKLLNKSSVKLKDLKLQSGGLYQWQVHARDINEHILLGDFNHGSLSKAFDFSIKD